MIEGNAKETSRWQQLRVCFIATCLWGVAAHGFCYLNGIFSHDSLLIYQDDNQFKLELGRVLTPLYRSLRSPYTAPWLIGVMSLVWLTFAVYFLVRTFGIERKLYIILIAGLLATNYSLSLTNATYFHDSDCYMLAVALAAAGAYFTVRIRWGAVLGGICIAGSLGLYQADMPLALMVYVLVFLKMAIDGQDIKKLLYFVGKCACSMAVVLIFYRLEIWWFMGRKGIALGTGYNSIQGVGDFSGVDIWDLLRRTVKYVFDFFTGITAYNLVRVRNATIGTVFLTVLIFVVLMLRKEVSHCARILAVLALLAVPLLMNSVYFISKGMNEFHHLMIYPFVMVYVALVIFMHIWDSRKKGNEKKGLLLAEKGLRVAAVVCLGTVLLNNVTFANDIYLKKYLEAKGTLSLMTRIVDRMEQTEGYVPAETEVVLAGELLNSTYNRMRIGFGDFGVLTGQSVPFSTTYYNTYRWYFQYVLDEPVLLADGQVRGEYMAREDVRSMPAFPGVGSVQMIDGRLVVKLGELR